MAYTHIYFNENTPYGRKLRFALNQLEEGVEAINDIFNAMVQMKDGDGSQAVHFARNTTLFGFESDAKSKEAYDEINSLQAKLNTNNSVTDVNAALLQAFNKLR